MELEREGRKRTNRRRIGWKRKGRVKERRTVKDEKETENRSRGESWRKSKTGKEGEREGK